MEIEMARNMLRTWAEIEPVRIYEPKKAAAARKPESRERRKTPRMPDMSRFGKRYGILIIAATLFTLYTIILSACVEHSTEIRVRQEMADATVQAVEAYKAEQARAAQAEHFLSGDASREAFLNQEIDAGARLIQEEPNETMRGTKLGVAIARLMSGAYGDTLQAVVNQPDQWMNYHSDVKITKEVRSFAEKIIRAYYEDGMVPDGLTKDIQWLTWTPGDYLARNNWNASAATVTWRYHG